MRAVSIAWQLATGETYKEDKGDDSVAGANVGVDGNARGIHGFGGVRVQCRAQGLKLNPATRQSWVSAVGDGEWAMD